MASFGPFFVIFSLSVCLEGAMRTIIVHPSDPQADASSLTHAFDLSKPSDIVLVQSGQYSPAHTGERCRSSFRPE